MCLTKRFKKFKLTTGLNNLNQHRTNLRNEFTGREEEMIVYVMTEAEMQLAQIIWDNEPLPSGELVKLASEKLGWKKSTTYTVLRKICENEIFQNQGTVVTALMSREEYIRLKGERYLEENYGGSLPGFVAAFLQKKKLSKKEVEEMAKMIEDYREE